LRRADATTRGRYQAWAGQLDANVRRERAKPFKLMSGSARLRAEVAGGLRKKWSPEQVAGRLRREFPDEPEMWVSHTTIYRSIYVLGRRRLLAELDVELRSGRVTPRRRGGGGAYSRIKDATPISERPEEAADRSVPGHWEGDLIKGKANGSALATLVERRSRYTMLTPLPDGFKADQLAPALAATVAKLPAVLKQTLTWDRGTEMAKHAAFTVASDVKVYFADPHSPWQRPTNENTNGLIRQYLPKGTDLAAVPAERIAEIAAELNDRPRKVLDFATPAEVFIDILDHDLGATTS
jgi:IS30 family transposase